jgi:rSAM/selenodomain-associated transferase 2
MDISIIIPTYNEAANIGKTVERLRANGGACIREILVVDGGSTDETVRIATEAGAKVLLCPEKSRAAQMNLGAARSQGELLYFVHADVCVPDDYVSQIATAVSQGWKMGNFRYRFDSNSWLLRFNASFTRFPFMFCQGGDKTLFVDRDLFFELGGYDPAHIIMEEFDFMKRAAKEGYKWIVMPSTCVVSARKYKKNSWLKVQIANILVFNMWNFGLAKPPVLKRIYGWMLA